ncbi:unnamed protein product [Cercopithifilaria johnstoni]|uniref:Transmembrane protein n=1 Tax=Cercopithifilaria johnstoni TaxID=2874296 RepID=A0A8J2M5X4_9BILA|nr:unnamed protein product [Cercopithifilaria johnstoni]
MNLESGIKQRSAPSSSASVLSPQITSQTNPSEQRNIWRRVNIHVSEQKSEQEKNWKQRNTYHISQGIEFWEDEDEQGWETIDIGGKNENEAKWPVEKAITNSAQIESGIAFFLLALIPIVGAAALTLCTAIYNAASAVGVITAAINIYSFDDNQPSSLSYFIQVAGIVAIVQTASFGIILIFYFKLLASATTTNYPKRTVLFLNCRKEKNGIFASLTISRMKEAIFSVTLSRPVSDQSLEEESLTGDVYLESGIKQKSAPTPSASIRNSQITSQTNHSASEDSVLQNVRQFARAREQRNRQLQTTQEIDKLFIISLIWFGIQIIAAFICIGFSLHQVANNAQIESAIAFLLLAMLPMVGAVGGIFSALTKNQTFTMCIVIYNVASVVGVITAMINVYSFEVNQPFSLSGFIQVAGVVAIVQTVSFGIVLVLYFKLLASAATIIYPERSVLYRASGEESLTGDVYLENGIMQKSAPSSSISVPSPQVTSTTIPNEQRNISERRLNIRMPEQKLEQKKYWEYRNVYHIPVPQGIEFWDNEDKKRWEMINIGGLDESEANRQIRREKMQQFAKARQQETRKLQTAVGMKKFFIMALLCFGIQIITAFACIGFSIQQFTNNAQIQSGIAFLLLAMIPMVGAVGGIFSALTKNQTFTMCTAIYNVASVVGVITAVINVYSFEVNQPFSLSGFIPVASVVAIVQIVSFVVFLVLYFKLLACTTAIIYPESSVLYHANAEVQRSDRGLYHKQNKLKERKKIELELDEKTKDVTQKYKQYLQKKSQIAEKSEKSEVQEEGSFEENPVAEKQITEPPGSREVKK